MIYPKNMFSDFFVKCMSEIYVFVYVWWVGGRDRLEHGDWSYSFAAWNFRSLVCCAA